MHEGEAPEQQSREGIDPRPAGTCRETKLLEKASAVGDAGTKYAEGRGAIEVLDGGGELAGYGSTEITVVFAPLTVGEFRTVKVSYVRKEQSIQQFACFRFPASHVL